MKPIYLFTEKVITHSCNGAKLATPIYIRWYFVGNVIGNKKFIHRWFVWTGLALHFFGFRFLRLVDVYGSTDPMAIWK